MMPQVDGWEMLRRVQERHGVGAIPVVMFSGKVDEQTLADAAVTGRAGLHRQAVRPAAADRVDEAAPAGLALELSRSRVDTPAAITPIPATSAIQMPIPRPSFGTNSSGIEMIRIRMKIVRDRADHDDDEALRHGVRQIDAELVQHLEQHDRRTEDEDELPEHARVPAGHGDRRARRRSPCTSP